MKRGPNDCNITHHLAFPLLPQTASFILPHIAFPTHARLESLDCDLACVMPMASMAKDEAAASADAGKRSMELGTSQPAAWGLPGLGMGSASRLVQPSLE